MQYQGTAKLFFVYIIDGKKYTADKYYNKNQDELVIGEEGKFCPDIDGEVKDIEVCETVSVDNRKTMETGSALDIIDYSRSGSDYYTNFFMRISSAMGFALVWK